MNRELAEGLRRKARELAVGNHFRIALFVAARNIEAYEFEITTEVQASAVKGVGTPILKELRKLGLPAATSTRDRMFLQGMETSPGKRKRGSSPRASMTPSQENHRIVVGLREKGKDIDGPYGIALMTAARNIAQWPTKLKDAMDLMKVTGVGAELAEMIVTEILGRGLSEDENAFLAGAVLKRSR